MTFHIWFDSWLEPNPYREDFWHIPRFSVSQGERALFVIDVLLRRLYSVRLRKPHHMVSSGRQGEQQLLQELREEGQQLRLALLRYAVRRIEQGLSDGFFPPTPPQEVLQLHITETELPVLEQLLREKTCTYQLQEGRDLFCSAASRGDATIVIGNLGLRAIAPTSRPLCRMCTLPDTDYLCSHLLHPAIADHRHATRDPADERRLIHAHCNQGRSEVKTDPSKCHAGGHPCWERIVEGKVEIPAVPASPMALPEALDYLDTVWRLWKKERLFHFKSAADPATLALPCGTSDELRARVSALADVLKSMVIPDSVLPAKAVSIPKDHTFVRLLACLEPELDEADYQACVREVGILRAVNDVRTAGQHSGAADKLPPAFDQLGIPYPPPSWGEAWDRIRAKTVGALAVLREQIRRLAIT